MKIPKKLPKGDLGKQLLDQIIGSTRSPPFFLINLQVMQLSLLTAAAVLRSLQHALVLIHLLQMVHMRENVMCLCQQNIVDNRDIEVTVYVLHHRTKVVRTRCTAVWCGG